MKKLLILLVALLFSTGAFAQGLKYGTQTVSGSAPAKSATEIVIATDLTTFTTYVQDQYGNTNAVTNYNPVEIYQTADTKTVRYVLPGTGAVTRLTPQGFAGFDTLHFTVTEWSSGIADTVGSSSSVNIRVNGSIYPALTKPMRLQPIPVKHYPIGDTDISNATQDIEMLGLYEIPNAQNYSFIYFVTGTRTANATEEIIITGRKTKVD